MKVLVVFHGWLPRDDRPVSGGALRAWHHGQALAEAGHEVVWLTRDQDHVPGGPSTYRSGPELRRLAGAARADRIVCVQPEEAPWLAGLGVPLLVDAFAPRLLEAVFEDTTATEAVRTLRALDAGDAFLFSNPRQRWFFQGLMVLAGVDLRVESGRVVPLVAPRVEVRRRVPKKPRLIMGGVSWPWQAPQDALRAAASWAAEVDGEVVVVGGRPAVGDARTVDLRKELADTPVRFLDAVPYTELHTLYAGATAALDVMTPNAEREVALSFRQLDYLACGLPIITGTHHALSATLAEHEAGWVVHDVAEALRSLTPDEVRRRGKNARRLARERFSRAACEAPLLAWVEAATVRQKTSLPLPEAAELAAALTHAEGELAHLAVLVAKAEAEVAEKREANTRLADQVAALTGTAARLARAVDEVAGFKREAVAVLGAEREAANDEARSLRDQLTALRADAAKKDAELRSTARDRDRIGQELAGLREELSDREDRLNAAAGDAQRAREGRAALRAELSTLREQVAEGRGLVDKKDAELSAGQRERDALQQELSRQRAESAATLESAKVEAERLRDEILKKTRELAECNGELHRVHDRAGRYESELEAAQAQKDALQKENERLSKRRFLS